MGRFNLKQASLLDASGELGEPAREKLAQRLIDDPEARRQHEIARDNLAVLQILPIPEPSAAERRAIPYMIKRAIRIALLEKEAAPSDLSAQTRDSAAHRRVGWAAGALALAACVAIAVSLALVSRSQNAEEVAQIARINAIIDHSMVPPDHSALAYHRPGIDEPSFADLTSPDAPAMSSLRDYQGNLHIARRDTDEPTMASDPAGPPG